MKTRRNYYNRGDYEVFQTKKAIAWVRMTQMGKTLQNKINRRLFLSSELSWCSPGVINCISGESTWPKEQECMWFKGRDLNYFQDILGLPVLKE